MELILLIPPSGIEPELFSFKVRNVSNYTTGEWMPRQDSHLQPPDSESGDLLIRLLGSGWGSRNRTYDLSVNSGLLCHSAIPQYLARLDAKPPRSDLNG
jgi:hypothetical protein